MDIPEWLKIAAPLAGGFCGGFVWPKVRKAIKNRGKTEQEIAAEELDAALAKAEHAHKTPDPADDAIADAAVERERAEYNKIRRARAVWDGIAEDE
jgi:F0F1-type ATP synthase membrane subunit b/b'